MISVLGKEAWVEPLAAMTNKTIESLEVDLGAELLMCLRVSSSSQNGGDWI